MNRCALLHRLWRLQGQRHARRLRQALADPEAVQRALLRQLLERNAETHFGLAHGFSAIRSLEDFRERVPVQHPDALARWVEAIQAGEPGVLTRDPVTRLVPTSGTTGPVRLIPWNRGLQRQFGRAIGAWTHDLLERDPALMGGPAYWSISPAGPQAAEASGSAVPVGTDRDSAYLGRWLAPLVDATLAVPDEVRRLETREAFRYATLLFLLRSRELRLISVWHPAFLTLLFDALPGYRERLLADLEAGTFTPPGEVPADVAAGLGRRLAPQPIRARELASHDFLDATRLWPALRLVSCWQDARAAEPARALAARLPGVRFQAKGLLATEAMVSLPFAGRYPLAVTAHVFEFVDDSGRARWAHEVQEGKRYRLLVTTAGGLYRYDLGDRVEVTGRLGGTPTLRFVGRAGGISDLCGEKLSDAFVGAALDALLAGLEVEFAMLAPERDGSGRPGYVLFLETAWMPDALAERLEARLAENPHYAQARWLGQLAPVVVEPVKDAQRAYLSAPVHRGGLGDIKPAALDAREGWRRRLECRGT
ncbi:GH3 auxin-responsive promoter family protein [Halomonas sp.]|uniref:GH3 family domain-containing protein n=2 Tax=Halomonas sp. TaxID=1486246 RepID=UPI0025B7F475|nr:GH3 auxin-responsive promoter family protein [Halomonas sp.]